jgi:hypothetical protein
MKIVIPTGAIASLREAIAEWRDLLFASQPPPKFQWWREGRRKTGTPNGGSGGSGLVGLGA